MNKTKEVNLIYVVFIVLTLIFSICNLITKNYFSKIVAVILLILNLANVIKYQKDKRIFFISIILFYFNYSIIICKYIFGGNNLLDNLYNQLFYYDDTMGLSINLLLIFNSIFYLPISLYSFNDENKEQYKQNEYENKTTINKYDINIVNDRNKKIIILLLKLLIVAILGYHILMKITYNTSLFEYMFIIFIFAFLLSKGSKKDKITFEVLLVLCSIYSLYVGERIGVLQFLIVDFIINYLDKFKKWIIIICMALGIMFFTFMGVYGDILDSSKRTFNELTIAKVAEAFIDRRLALDTCVSAYFSSSSMIEVSQQKNMKERVQNFKDYFTKYLILGAKSNYDKLNKIIAEYQVNYGGGYIIGYFYYWLGTVGVILIAIYVGWIMRKIIQINENSSNFIKTYAIFFISTIPRWYLYVPSLLFRGTLVFIIIYIVINFLINKNDNNNDTISKLEN